MRRKLELLFVKWGIAFILLGPVVITMLEYDKAKAAKQIQHKEDQYKLRVDDERWSTGIDCYYAFNRAAPMRDLLLKVTPTQRARLIDALDVSVIKVLIIHLENRPEHMKHDVPCIRLLGELKNYLKALDEAISGGILEVLPKRPEDKSC